VPADTPAAFFSYCREDSEFALRLPEDLKGAGANVWMDQLDIEPGTPWDRAVEDALIHCPRLLIILSPISVASDNVRDEVSFALSRQKRVIPVLYRDCDVPFRVARLQHVDFRANYDRGLKTLLKVLGASQPKISRHLAYLRRAGIVAARRNGKWMHYRITPPSNPHAKRILDDVLSWLKDDKDMQRDRAYLMKVCCMPSPPVQLLGAPKPIIALEPLR